jgi:hypothetical protein
VTRPSRIDNFSGLNYRVDLEKSHYIATIKMDIVPSRLFIQLRARTQRCYAPIDETRGGACTVPLHFWHIWRDHMLKAFGAALLLVSAFAMTADPARALQVVVTQADKNTDGSMTYHFAVKTDPGETLTPGASKATGDFVTVYNFYGLIDGSAKVPEGWEFSSEASGRTPELGGYPLVLPVDVPNTPNLTWTVTKPVAAGVQIDGFTATTRVSTIVEGQYTGQVTRQAPPIRGVAAGTPGAAATVSKQALIGALSTPSFLAGVK